MKPFLMKSFKKLEFLLKFIHFLGVCLGYPNIIFSKYLRKYKQDCYSLYLVSNAYKQTPTL